MTILVRQPFVVYVFNDDLKGSVFARFHTQKEADAFCRDWQNMDPAHLYAVSNDFDL